MKNPEYLKTVLVSKAAKELLPTVEFLDMIDFERQILFNYEYFKYPHFISGYPKVKTFFDSKIEIWVETDKESKVYAVLIEGDVNAPNVYQVAKGKDGYNKVGVAKKQLILKSNSEKSFIFTGFLFLILFLFFSELKTETLYKVYLAIEDIEIPGAFNSEVSSVMY